MNSPDLSQVRTRDLVQSRAGTLGALNELREKSELKPDDLVVGFRSIVDLVRLDDELLRRGARV